MKNKYSKVVQFLEGLQIMPKTMPGLQKIKKALEKTDWYREINPEKVIVVAGTNGKGSTCASLEALLLHANQKIGFYSSPHLVSTTERIRMNGMDISEEDFVKVFEQCEALIQECELSHFEALTLMAGHFYFSKKWNQSLDYVIFEVGLGGTFDATNAFPHRFSVITPLAIDHTNILGKSLLEIAKNKFGIIHDDNIVVHQKLSPDLEDLLSEFLKKTNSKPIQAPDSQVSVKKELATPQYVLRSQWGDCTLSLLGRRASENANLALTVFAGLGFDPRQHLKALNQVQWQGRMQKIDWPGAGCSVFISGDHNPQGVASLLEILKDFSWKAIHIVIGIGVDKEASEIFNLLNPLHDQKIYLTVTPFKGRRLDQYPESVIQKAELRFENPIEALQAAAKNASTGDLILVTGSLYLVGEVLKYKT